VPTFPESSPDASALPPTDAFLSFNAPASVLDTPRRLPPLRSAWIGLCTLLGVIALSGCQTVSSVLPTKTETKPVPKDTVLVTTNDSTDLRPEVARLYALEAELLSTQDSARTAQLLNQAMSELAGFLRRTPDALEDDAVRRLYSGLTSEYRRFHGYGTDPDSLQMARGQIFSVRAQLFASLDEVEAPLVEEAPPVRDAGVSDSEIPMTSNRLVNQSISYLQDEPDGHVNRWLRRVQVYGPMVSHILAEEDVPGDRLSLATMHIQSNDFFYAFDPAGLPLFDESGEPISGDVTGALSLYDARTEQNQENGVGINQAPRQPGPDTGPSESGPVERITDEFDGNPLLDVIEVTVTPVSQ